MSVFLSPVGLAAAPTANTVALLATFKEKLCRVVCATSTNQPQATVTYRYEQPVLNGNTVFVPIVATTAVTINQEGTVQGLVKVVCGKSGCYAVNSALSVTITPAG